MRTRRAKSDYLALLIIISNVDTQKASLTLLPPKQRIKTTSSFKIGKYSNSKDVQFLSANDDACISNQISFILFAAASLLFLSFHDDCDLIPFSSHELPSLDELCSMISNYMLHERRAFFAKKMRIGIFGLNSFVIYSRRAALQCDLVYKEQLKNNCLKIKFL